MSATRQAVEDAVALGAQRLPDPETGARELAGYARFLRYAGNHLQTVMRLGEIRHDGAGQLVKRLNALTDTEPTHGRWLHAATLLGTAHDLLATHLTGVGVPRTAEGEELLSGPGALVSCVEVAQLILTAIDGSHELIRRTARAQKGRVDKPVDARTFTHLHATNRAASLCARAALWDLSQHTTGIQPSMRLGQLRAAVHLQAGRPPEFVTTMAALRLLREYSYSQARGLAAASPASLRDLAQLGSRVTDPEATLAALPTPTTPLDRLQRAHLADQLAAARQAWTTAGDELTRSVQGLTKAPTGYAAAIHQLLDAELTPGLRRAIGSALPRMATDAATTIETLAQNAELVTLQQPSLKTRHEWRPILPDHATAIADQFTEAGQASRRAFTTLTTLSAPRRPPTAHRPHEGVHLERHRQVQR